MVFVHRDHHFVRQAASPPDFPDPPFVTVKTSRPKELIIADIRTGPLPVLEPADAFAPVIAAGYRSFWSVIGFPRAAVEAERQLAEAQTRRAARSAGADAL